MEIEEVVQLYEAACAANAHTYDVVFDFKYWLYLESRGQRYEKPLGGKRLLVDCRVHETLGDGKLLVETYDAQGTLISRIAWCDDTYRILDLRTRSASIDTADRYPFADTATDPWDTLFRRFHALTRYPEILRSRLPLLTTKAQGKWIVVEAPPHEPGEAALSVDRGRGYRLFLDPSTGMLPARIERYAKDDNKTILKAIEAHYTQLENGQWIAESGTVRNYALRRSEPQFGQLQGEGHYKLDLSKCRFNIPLARENFLIEFPKGTEVLDRLTNSFYVVGAEETAEHLDYLANRSKELIEKHTRNLTPWWTLSRSESALVVAGNLLCVALLILVLWHRRREKRRRVTGKVLRSSDCA